MFTKEVIKSTDKVEIIRVRPTRRISPERGVDKIRQSEFKRVSDERDQSSYQRLTDK